MTAIKQLAMPVVMYSLGIVDWPQGDTNRLDTETTKLLILYRVIYRNKSVSIKKTRSYEFVRDRPSTPSHYCEHCRIQTLKWYMNAKKIASRTTSLTKLDSFHTKATGL